MVSRLSVLNSPPRRFPGPSHLHELVAKDTVVDDIAIEYHDFRNDAVRITYQELHTRADELAAYITAATQHRSSLTKHFIVPLLLPQCPELYISQLAILKAGGAFCPLPVDAPEDRLSFILRDVGAGIILTTSSLRSHIPQSPSITIINVDERHDHVSAQCHRAVTPASDLAYVMYTSGSTGLPKGVLLSHSAVVQALLAHDRHIPVYSRFLQFAAPTFDVSVFEIFFTLFRGRTIICCERTHLLSNLPGTINALNIDAAELTPSVASNLLGLREAVPGLKILLTIGEMLRRDVIERYGGDAGREAMLQAMYGPTEATIHCTIEPDCQQEMPAGNIGFPLDTVSAFIVRPASEKDSSLCILPLGEEGELAVGGYQLADGYLNRDEQTKAAFQTHSDHGQLYRTGDRARMTEDGRIHCLGRISAGQVKLRGQRIELGEVEYAVAKTPGCCGAVAEVMSNALVAFYKCDPSSITEAEVSTVCKQWLSAYMVPTEFVRLDEFPYLPSGKIDRKALRTHFEESKVRENSEPVYNEEEQINTLTKTIRCILGQQAVKNSDLALPNIDSLTSIRLVSELSKLGYPRPMATHVMAARTIYDLSDILTDARASKSHSIGKSSHIIASKRRQEVLLHPLVRQQARRVELVMPCSAVQAAMLALTTTNSQLYCNWIRLGISSIFEDKHIEQALRALISQHELLRAGFLVGNATSSAYDIIIYKDSEPEQITWTSKLQPAYSKASDTDLLTASKFQLHRARDEVEVLLQIHHALYDQWSIDILKHDLCALLQGISIEASSFSRILEYYIDNVEEGVSGEAIDFWVDQMAAIQPTTFPNTSSIKHNSCQARTAWEALEVDQTLLCQVANRHGWSQQAILQTVFAYLISQYVGSADIVYGTVLSGRHIAVSGIDQVFGPALTTLPMHVNINGKSSWSHLISYIHSLSLKILAHSATPITQIIRQANTVQGDTLFDTLFIWQESTVSTGDQKLVWEIDSADYHEFKVVVEIRPLQDSIQGRVTYDLSIMPSQQAQQFLSQIETITGLILNGLDGSIDQLDKRLPNSLLSISNPSPIYAAASVDLVADLEDTCRAQPELDALVVADSFDDLATFKSLTFRQMHQKANQIANYLVDQGVQPDDLVVICMEKSLDFYVTILAVIKAGAGYLPMVPEIQAQRAAAILGQVTVKAILLDEYAIEMARTSQAPIVHISKLDLASYDKSSPDVASNSSHVAYTIFTSGSTGVPKGVTVTRGNLHGNIRVLRDMYEYQHGDRLLQACSQSFDVAVFETFFSFLAGLTICTARKDILFDNLPRSIKRLGATHLSMTPTVASLVQPADVPAVKFLVTAGEAMTAAVHRSWGGKGLHQGYGPSETTNICTVNMNITPQHHLGSIGPPFSNTSAFVLDPDHEFRVLPQGAHGEFAFGGEQVFRGYLGLDKLNIEKIYVHPQYGKLYRSGDLGRILADGSLLIHGRSDFQVKIRGNRVELGEINATVLRNEAVDDCFTVALTDLSTLPILVSYWVPRHGDKGTDSIIEWSDRVSTTTRAIFRTLEAALPSYMMPTYVFPVTDLPRTTQGKMDQRVLEQLFGKASQQEKLHYSQSDPRDEDTVSPLPVEAPITKVLAVMLQISVKDIHRTANLDTLGINSVNAISLAKALTKELHQLVQVSLIFRHASVARLARALNEDNPTENKVCARGRSILPENIIETILESLPADHEPVQAVLPCTPLQEAMLAATIDDGRNYSNSTTLRINGDVTILKDCFQQIFQRHAILRTIFVDTQFKDQPFAQVVLENISLPWKEQNAQFDAGYIGSISLHHPVLLCERRNGAQLELHMQMHHAVYDGISIAIMLAEIEALYHRRTLYPAPSPHNFLEECAKQAGTEAQEFWTSKLAGFRPRPFARSQATKSQAEHEHTRLIEVSLSDIQEFVKNQNVEVTSMVHAAWAKCLAYLQGYDDVCFGDVVSGRLPDLESIDLLVAPCFNTVPVRTDLARCKTNLDLVQRLHRFRSSAKRYQLTPLRMIQRTSTRPSKRLFDSLVIVQPPAEKRDESIWSLVDERGGMGLPLVLEISPQDQQCQVTLHSMPAMTAEIDAALVVTMFEQSLQDLLKLPSNALRGSNDWCIPSLRHALAANTDDDDNRDDQSDLLKNANGAAKPGQQWSTAELMIRDILGKLAKVEPDKIQRDTSIYQLGLDSLNAAQIATRIRANGHYIDLADVLEYRTPRAIAAAMQSQASQPESNVGAQLASFDKTHRSLVLEQNRDVDLQLESIRPCTPAQQGMLAQSIASHGKLYINHVWLKSQVHLSQDAVSYAWMKVQDRHPILRTGFLQDEDCNSPFFMFTHKPGTSHPRITISQHKTTIDLEDMAASEIVNSMRTPLWRVCLVASEEQMVMGLSLHHALYDAVGLQILLADFELAIQGSELEKPYALDKMLIPILSTMAESASEIEKFWLGRLGTASFTPFPSLTPRIVKQTCINEIERRSVVASIDLERLCSDNRCTIQAAMQAAWARLLKSYLGEGNVTFGTVLSSRSGADDSTMVFPCINTIPVYAEVLDDDRGLLKRMVDYNAAVQRYRSTPPADIQRYAGKPGETLFDTVVVYQRRSATTIVERLLAVERQSAAVDYKISLELETTQSGTLHFHLSFADSILPEAHAALMLEQYEAMLLQEIGHESIEMRQSAQVLSITMPKQREIPSSFRLLHQAVEQTAAMFPDRVALDFVRSTDVSSTIKSRWTYRELNELGNKVAGVLTANGAQEANIIAVCMNKCPEASFAFLGILKAGCAFLALDPELPKARKDYILKDSAARILLTDDSFDMEELDTEIPCIDLTMSSLASMPTRPLPVQDFDDQATCYCLYTSGTTGTPKGCEISHESAVQAMLSFQRLFADHWNEESRWLQFASYWFDVSVLEHFWSWSVGITMVGAPRDLVLSDIVGFINHAQISHIDLTPSLARLLDPEDVPCLCRGVFITGGEALKQEIIQRWGEHGVICNGYGPTEATIGVTMNTFIGTDAKSSNIGPAFDNVGSCVIDPQTLRPILTGAIGELCVFGKLVGKGYLNRPDLTAAAFPVLDAIKERIYRTGDLVRQLADGSFLFVGRKDSQAKLRGQRLEIDEIDSIIKSSHPSIADVASLVVKSIDGNKQTLVSFMTTEYHSKASQLALATDETSSLGVAQSLDACKKFLPGYMVPTHIIPLNKIPLTVNNKTDTKALTTFYNHLSLSRIQSLQGASTTNCALDEKGRQVASVLAKMLAIDETDIDGSSNVFSLGLSSVSAISFVKQLKKIGIERANVADIMRRPQMSQLVEALSKNDNAVYGDFEVQQAKLTIGSYDQRFRKQAAEQLEIQVSSIDKIVPCTPLQEGILLESMKSAHQPYFNTFEFELHEIDVDKLQAAVERLANEVEILRVSFTDTDEGYLQVFSKRPTWTVRRIVGRHRVLQSIRADLKQTWLERNKVNVVNPFQPCLVRHSSGSTLIINIHHAMYDGISFDLLMQILAKIYMDKDPDYGPVYTSILPFGPLQQLAGAKEFWTKALQEFDHRPMIRKYLDEKGSRAIAYKRTLTHEHLEESRQTLGISHQAILQAAYQVALCHYSPATSTYGVVTSGRALPVDGADRALGPLFNTLPTMIAVTPAVTWRELVTACHRWTTSCIPYQHTPLRDIRKWSGRSSQEDLFESLFVLHVNQDIVSDAAKLWTQVEDVDHAEYPLAFEVELQSGGKMNVNIVAQAVVADETDLAAFLSTYDAAIQQIIDNVDSVITDTFDLDLQHAEAFTKRTHTTSADVHGVHNFTWSHEAQVIREEMARLANVTVDEVDEHDSIFMLGLDSIDAVKLASRLRKRKIDLKVSAILQSQSIPRMMNALQEHEGGADPKSTDILSKLQSDLAKKLVLPAVTTNVERILPATPGQEALLAPMLQSDFTEYFNHDLLKLGIGINADKLKEAWETVINASPILRTSFVPVDRYDIKCAFAQVVHKAQAFSFGKSELKHISNLSGLMDQIRCEVATTVETQSPMRLTFVTIGQQKHLLLSISHALYDGHSLALLHNDIAQAYNNAYQSRPSADTAINNALLLAEGISVDFWVKTLSGSQPSHFYPVNTQGKMNAANRYELTSVISANEARAQCRKLGVSMQALAQTCWSLLLASYSKQLEVMFGVVLACRDSDEDEQVMFPMMNTIIVRSSLFGSLKDMLGAIQTYNSDMLPHKQTPLRLIKAAHRRSGPEYSIMTELFDTLFIYQHRPESIKEQSQPLYESAAASSSVDYSVAAEMEVSGEAVIFRAAAKDSILSQSDTKILVQRLDQVLQRILRNADQPTVNFYGDKVSVCGLPAFTQAQVPVSTKEEREHDELAEVSNEDIKNISSVLARVSGTRVADISLSSSLESLGIDSISVIKVSILLKNEGIKVKVGDLLGASSVSKIASLVKQKEDKSAMAPKTYFSTAVKALSREDLSSELVESNDNIEYIVPALAGQIYMLSIWSRTRGRLFYPTFTYQVHGNIQISHIQQAWDTLVAKHSILRTVFVNTRRSASPVAQVILREAESSVQFSDGVWESHHQPFVSLRATETRTGWKLQLRIHHALYDAISLDLLIDDLGRLINHEQIRISPPSFNDYISHYMRPAAEESDKEFWTRYLGNISTCRLQASKQQATARVEIFQPSVLDNAAKLEGQARKHNLHIQSILFAAWSKVYAAHCIKHGNISRHDVVLGIYLSNRSHLDGLLELRAPTLNLLPLLVRRPLDRPLLQIAKDIQQDLAGISTAEHAMTALWQIVKLTGIHVDIFLNFVKLPDAQETAQRRRTIAVESLDTNREDERAQVVPVQHNRSFALPSTLRDMPIWNDAYVDSLDIEMSVAHGSLDIGVFALDSIIGLAEAQGMLRSLQQELHDDLC